MVVGPRTMVDGWSRKGTFHGFIFLSGLRLPPPKICPVSDLSDLAYSKLVQIGGFGLKSPDPCGLVLEIISDDIRVQNPCLTERVQALGNLEVEGNSLKYIFPLTNPVIFNEENTIVKLNRWAPVSHGSATAIHNKRWECRMRNLIVGVPFCWVVNTKLRKRLIIDDRSALSKNWKKKL